jgi:predicted trehalose synthase
MASRTPPSDVVAAWVAGQRWFATKTRRIEHAAFVERIPLGGATLAIVEVRLDDRRTDRYAVPLASGPEPADALADPVFCRALLDLIQRGGTVTGAAGDVRGAPTSAFPPLSAELPVRRLGGEQSNTSVAFGQVLIMKHFRRLAEGLNPEQEITAFLTERTAFRSTPRLAGALEYRARAGPATTLAVVQEYVPGARDGWEWSVERVREFYAQARADPGPPDPVRARAVAGPTLDALRALGQRTGELHRALASDPNDPAFAPEVIGPDDLDAWAAGVHRQLAAAVAAVGDRRLLPGPVDPARGLRGLAGRQKIRHHGDFHLGQTLYREGAGDFVIIDFEGEPIRPLPERRRKHAAVRDVAGMLRSIDYVATAARPPGVDGLEGWRGAWEAEAAAAFVAGYRRAAGQAAFLPASDPSFADAVAVFELEKAAYEVVYEANHRPAWVDIPRRGLLRAARRLGSDGGLPG